MEKKEKPQKRRKCFTPQELIYITDELQKGVLVSQIARKLGRRDTVIHRRIKDCYHEGSLDLFTSSFARTTPNILQAPKRFKALNETLDTQIQEMKREIDSLNNQLDIVLKFLEKHK